MIPVKKILLEKLLQREDITEEFQNHSIDIILADDTVINIEFFERYEGAGITIRTEGSMAILPGASNSINVKGIQRI